MNGHGVAPAKQTVQDGSKAMKPVDPTAVGYTFGGWYKDATCTVKFDFNSAIHADTVLYAKWTQNSVTPVTPGKPGTPNTGDDSNLLLWAVVMLAGCGVFSVAVLFGRKKKS